MMGAGFLYEKTIIWYKGQGTATQKLFGSYPYPGIILVSGVTEHIITARKPRGKHKEDISDETKEKSKLTKDEWAKWAIDLWEFAPVRKSQSGHTAAFPFELPKRCIRLFSFYEDIVLDPFMGSGTTARSAIHTGRKYIGYEIHKDCVKRAEDSISNKVGFEEFAEVL